MTKMEKLKVAVDSQNFYFAKCEELEKKVDEDVKYIVHVEHEKWTKERMEQSLTDCHNLMILSSKFVSEAEGILSVLSSLTRDEYESDVELIAEIALTTRQCMRKQKKIYEKLIELQAILIEIIERF
jgi:hypothetical protein